MSKNIVPDFQWDVQSWKNPSLAYFKMQLLTQGETVRVENVDASPTVSIQEIIALFIYIRLSM